MNFDANGKYVTPKLPTAQNIMEDLSNESSRKSNNHLKFAPGDSILMEAYSCYSHMNHMKNDIEKQKDLNAKLEDLNKELVVNIGNMKRQQ